MQDYDNARNAPAEPFVAKMTRWVGVGSSLMVVGGLAYWGYNLGSRDATNVPVINALTQSIRTEPEVVAIDETAQSNQVNGVLEGTPPSLTNEVTLAPEPTDMTEITPVSQNGTIVTPEVLDEFIMADESVIPITGPERRPELLYIPPKDQLNPLSAEARPIGATEEIIPSDVANATAIVEQAATEASSLPEVSTPSNQTAQEEVIVEEPVVSAEVGDEIANAKVAAEVAKAKAEQAAQDLLDAEKAAADAEANKLAAAKAEAEKAKQEQAAAEEEPASTGGSGMIQLAANTTLEDTKAQWAKLKAANSDVLGGKSLIVQKATVKGKVYYRLQVSGFADSAQAKSACATLAARNLQCMLVK